MKVKEIKNAVVNNKIEEKAFSAIININEEEEITKDELKEILDEMMYMDGIEIGNLAIDYAYANNEKDLLKWYLKDVSRLYKYANQAGANQFNSPFESDRENNDVVELLHNGQAIYWEKQIGKIRDRLCNFLGNWETK